MENIRRGEIYYADLSPVIGSEQGGVRPVLVLQNDVGNRFSSTTIVAAITSIQKKIRFFGVRVHRSFGTASHHRQTTAHRLSRQRR